MTFDSYRPVSKRIVAYLGPQGTHTEEVALSFYQNTKFDLRPYSSIDAAIMAVVDNEATECIVPVENSLEGSVNITLDTISNENDLYVTKEITRPIRHNLLVKDSHVDIRVIVSHAQALAQCRQTLKKLYPNAELKAMESTAEAASLVANGAKNYAAVGSFNAAKIYGLEIMATGIQDNSNNCTRFIVLAQQPARFLDGEKYKTSIACQINGERPGSLCEILQEFAVRNVNLTRIESRPARTGLGIYIFFLDLDGSMVENHVYNAVHAVQQKSLWFKNFGSYPICFLED